jgi:hypothetical protein
LLINFIKGNLSENLKIKECILLFKVIFFSGRVVCKDDLVIDNQSPGITGSLPVFPLRGEQGDHDVNT